MEFVPSKHEKHIFMIPVSFSCNVHSIAFVTILDLVEDTSVRAIKFKFILNSLLDSSKLPIKIPNISFRVAEVDSSAKITMSVFCFMCLMLFLSNTLNNLYQRIANFM